MLTILLPLVSLAVGLAHPDDGGGASDEMVTTTPRAAQAQLAVVLGEADAIHSVVPRGRSVAFTIDHGDRAERVIATVDARGRVIALALRVEGQPAADVGSLTWLADELREATAVTALLTDEDGAVLVVTNDDRRYMLIPGRGSGGAGGNEAVESRWAAAWDAPPDA